MKKVKRYIIILSAVILPAMLSAQNNESVRTLADNGTKSDTLSFTIYGMDCPGCEGGLEKQVNKIPSIKYADASWVDQELKVVVKEDAELDLKELEKRVKKANFTLVTQAKTEEDEDKK